MRRTTLATTPRRPTDLSLGLHLPRVTCLVGVAGRRARPQLATDQSVGEAEQAERQQVGGRQQEERVRPTPDGARLRPHLVAVHHLADETDELVS